MRAESRGPDALKIDQMDVDLLVASVMTAVRASGQDRRTSAPLNVRGLGLIGVAAAATVAIGGLFLLNLPRSGIGLASLAPTGPIVLVADEPAFTEPFRQVSDWGQIEAVFLPGLPERYATLEPMLASLRSFMLAGLHAPRGNEGVTIIVPSGASQATEVHLFIILHGGANRQEVGAQFRAVARHDARGWWIEPQMQARVFCDVPLTSAVPGVPPHMCY